MRPPSIIVTTTLATLLPGESLKEFRIRVDQEAREALTKAIRDGEDYGKRRKEK